VDPVEIFNLFKSFSFESPDANNWVIPVDNQMIKKEFGALAEEILNDTDSTRCELFHLKIIS